MTSSSKVSLQNAHTTLNPVRTPVAATPFFLLFVLVPVMHVRTNSIPGRLDSSLVMSCRVNATVSWTVRCDSSVSVVQRTRKMTNSALGTYSESINNQLKFQSISCSIDEASKQASKQSESVQRFSRKQ